MILVSKCLTGACCRYDGGSKPDAGVMALVAMGLAVPVCPEELGGLKSPRLPAELQAPAEDVIEGRGRVILRDGTDVTEQFIKGAAAALKIAKACGAKRAILKAKSPSCGHGLVYDGSFSGRLKEGSGLAAAMLKANGFEIETV